MASKSVVCLSYLFALLIISLRASTASREAPKGPSETAPVGGGRWLSSNGDFGMTEVAGSDLGHNGHNGAGFGGQVAAGTALGTSINGVGIGFGGGGGIGIGGSGGMGIGAGGGVGIGMGKPRIPNLPKPPIPDLPEPPIPCPDLPEPPIPGPDLPEPPSPVLPEPPIPDLPEPPVPGPDLPQPPVPKTPGGPVIGMGGGRGGGIGNHRVPTGSSTECQARRPLPGQLAGLRCQQLSCPNGDCSMFNMYFGSTSTSDEDELNKYEIHIPETSMSPDTGHDQIMMGNMDQHKTVETGEPDPDYSQMMSNIGSWVGLAMRKIHD